MRKGENSIIYTHSKRNIKHFQAQLFLLLFRGGGAYIIEPTRSDRFYHETCNGIIKIAKGYMGSYIIANIIFERLTHRHVGSQFFAQVLNLLNDAHHLRTPSGFIAMMRHSDTK